LKTLSFTTPRKQYYQKTIATTRNAVENYMSNEIAHEQKHFKENAFEDKPEGNDI